MARKPRPTLASRLAAAEVALAEANAKLAALGVSVAAPAPVAHPVLAFRHQPKAGVTPIRNAAWQEALLDGVDATLAAAAKAGR